MNRKRTRKPSHPGYVFQQSVLEPLGLNLTDAALKLDVSRKHLSGFVNGHVRCNLDMAQRIAIATKTSLESWINLQTALDIWEVDNHPDPKYAGVERLSE
jgi:addiction module HigA family antidote